MGRSKKDQCAVIWRATHEKSKRRWKNWFVLTQLFYLILVAFLGRALIHDAKIREAFIYQRQELEALKTKEIVYSILRSKGVSLSQGLDIAVGGNKKDTSIGRGGSPKLILD